MNPSLLSAEARDIFACFDAQGKQRGVAVSILVPPSIWFVCILIETHEPHAGGSMGCTVTARRSGGRTQSKETLDRRRAWYRTVELLYHGLTECPAKCRPAQGRRLCAVYIMLYCRHGNGW